jgi:hypothetical protein
MPSASFIILHLTVLFLYFPLTSAQFQNFFQGGFPFGGQRQQQQQTSDNNRHKGWTEMDAGQLSRYVECLIADVANLSSPLRCRVCLSYFISLCAYARRLSLSIPVSSYGASLPLR